MIKRIIILFISCFVISCQPSDPSVNDLKSPCVSNDIDVKSPCKTRVPIEQSKIV